MLSKLQGVISTRLQNAIASTIPQIRSTLYSRALVSMPTKNDGNDHEGDNKVNTTKEETDDTEINSGPYINPETGEVNGPRGPEPTRFGDWERGGRVSDF